MSGLTLGLDFGATGLRSAIELNGQQVVVPLAPALQSWRRWVMCLRERGGLGFTFPSMKSQLGTGLLVQLDEQTQTVDDAVTHGLRQLREQAATFAGKPMVACRIAVPIGYSEFRRAALVACAKSAGFHSVGLLSDATAAAMATFERSATVAATILVISCGYSGLELAAVRLARPRYRVLSQKVNGKLSGQSLNTQLQGAALKRLRDENVFLRWKSFPTNRLFRFMELVDDAKMDLAERDESVITLPGSLFEFERDLTIRLTSTVLDELTRDLASDFALAISEVLDDAGLTAVDLDATYLVGGSCALRAVRQMCHDMFGNRVVLCPPHVLAFGALAADDALGPSTQAQAPAPMVASKETTPTGGSPNETAIAPELHSGKSAGHSSSVHAAPSPPRAIDGPNLDDAVAHVRTLIDSDQIRAAANYVGHMTARTKEAVDLLAAASTHLEPRECVRRANWLVQAGNVDKAVALVHQAYRLASGDADVFEAYIDIHVKAAGMKSDVTEYATALAFLECASRLDPTNEAIASAIATRHLKHAEDLLQLKKEGDALHALELCLRLDPENAAARKLKASLVRSPPVAETLR